MPKPMEKLPLYISIISAIIVLLACIITSAPLYWMAAWVSLTIILFYFIGHCVRMFLLTTVFPPAEELPEFDGEAEYSDDHDIDEEDDGDLDNNPDIESEPVANAYLDE